MKYTLEEWKKEGERRFGKDIENWKFVCPACGKVSSGAEFKAAGAEPDDIYTSCIGRFNGHMVPASKSDGHGCDWCAYGLFGTMGKGDVVTAPNGKDCDVLHLRRQMNEQFSEDMQRRQGRHQRASRIRR